MTPTYQDIKFATESGKNQDGASHLGTLMWWSLNDNRISHQNLIDLANLHGLPEEYLPNEIKRYSAFNRAVQHAKKRLEKNELIRKIKNDKEEIVVGIVEEHIEERVKDLRFQVASRVTFNKTRERIDFDHEHRLASEITDLFYVHMDHGTNDVRMMMTNFLKLCGISIRPSGGVYFIPARYQSTLDALCAVVESCGCNSTFQLEIYDTTHAKGTMASVAQASLENEIKQIQKEIDEFAFDKAREKTLADKLEGFEALRAKAKMFASVLNFKADEIHQSLDKVRDVVTGHMTENHMVVPSVDTPEIFSEEAGF